MLQHLNIKSYKKNSKSEYRNPKQILNSKSQIPNGEKTLFIHESHESARIFFLALIAQGKDASLTGIRRFGG